MNHRIKCRRCSAFLPALAALFATLAPLSAQLSGLYTINPLQPASGVNFQSLPSAVAALQASGVSSPTVFEISDDGGPFTAPMNFVTSNVNWSLLPAPAPGQPFPPATAVLVLGTWAGVTAQNPVIFRAGPGESPIFDAANRSMGIFWNGADHVTVEGIEIRSAVYDGISIYGESTHGPAINPVIRRCRIHSCGGAGISIHGNTPLVQNPLIENNFFWNLQSTNAGGFNTISRFGYVSWRRQTGLRLRNNSFFVGTGTGPLFAVIGGIPGSLIETAAAEITGNILYKLAASSRPALLFLDIGAVSGLPAIMDRNCFHDVSGGRIADFGPTANLSAGTLSSWQAQTGRDLLSFSGNPLYADAGSGDLHLLAGSFCIDALGGSASAADDIDGQGRLGIADVGADEYVGPATPSVRSIGTGSIGSFGQLATITATNLPSLGNQGFSLSLAGALPFSTAFLFGAHGLDPHPMPVAPQAFVYLERSSLQQLVQQGVIPLGPIGISAAGTASIGLAIANHPNLAGLNLALQAAILDPATPLGLQLTNALDLVIH